MQISSSISPRESPRETVTLASYPPSGYMETNLPHSLHLLLDPQGFCESLFEKHLQNKKSKLPLETKLDILQLVTRLVGLHKLVGPLWLTGLPNSRQLTPPTDNSTPLFIFYFSPHTSTAIRYVIPGLARGKLSVHYQEIGLS